MLASSGLRAPRGVVRARRPGARLPTFHAKEGCMPPRGVKSPKRKRQYEKIKQSVKSRGGSVRRAKEIAARTVNKQRRKSGQTKAQRSRRGGSRKGRSRSTSS
jgi:hypothetical protein